MNAHTPDSSESENAAEVAVGEMIYQWAHLADRRTDRQRERQSVKLHISAQVLLLLLYRNFTVLLFRPHTICDQNLTIAQITHTHKQRTNRAQIVSKQQIAHQHTYTSSIIAAKRPLGKVALASLA